MASAYISRTTGTAFTSNQKFTASAWVKGKLPPAADRFIFNIGEASGSANSVLFYIASTGDLVLYGYNPTLQLVTDRQLRDPSAWYHIVLAVDTTQGTPADRNKVYINGEQITSFSSETNYGSSDTLGALASGKIQYIGSDTGGGSSWDGEMSHVQFVDGLQLAPTEFGEFDSISGIWKVKTSCYATPGNNGYCLKMEDRTNLDLDSSSNAHTFTTSGDVTATYDNPSDNFATLNPLKMSNPAANYILSQGNNTLTVTSNDFMRQTGVTINPEGLKGYFEFKCVADSNYQAQFQDVTVQLGKQNYYSLAAKQVAYLTWGDVQYSNGGSSVTHISAYFASPGAAVNDIMGCAFDFSGSNRNVWWHRNGTYGNNGSGVGVPSTGAYPALTATELPTTIEYEIMFAANSGTTCTTAFNFGNGYFGTTAISSAGTNASGIGEFEYDVPTGFTALSTKGLNE